MKTGNEVGGTKRMIASLSWATCLLVSALCSSAVHAQQTNAAMTPKQEFLVAVKNGEALKVREMLKRDPTLATAATAKGVSALLVAVYNGKKEIADLLLSTGIKLNIFEASATGRIERVRELLKKDRSLVNSYSSDGWTPLHLADFGYPEVAKLLLDNGAQINAVARNNFKSTPLQGAAAFKQLEVARVLIARGADVNPRGEGGYSPLHEAAGSGQLELARLLIKHKADVNAKGDDGKTPLAIALEYKQIEVANLLRQHGATQ